MANIYSILPPILVLILGYTTRRVVFSITSGIILACLIAENFNILNSLNLGLKYLWSNLEFYKLTSLETVSSCWNLFIFIFLIILGIFVTLIHESGGAYAYATFVKSKLKSKKNAEQSSLILSFMLFIDDYFSSLTVGSVMHPLTDLYKIARVKLAFLVDSLAAPLAILCPFSSWVAAIIGFLRENGIENTKTATTYVIASPFTTYLKILPFMFYSFLLMIGAIFIVQFNISFGNMKKHEDMALKGDLFSGKNPNKEGKKEKDFSKISTSLYDFIVPVLILIISIIAGMLYSGKYIYLGGSRSFMEAMQHSSAAKSLLLGGVVGLSTCILFLVFRNKIQTKALPKIFVDGTKLMTTAIIVLLLAWTFGDIIRNNLKTGEYLANLLIGKVDLIYLPVLFFITSLIIAFAIGSSWGTAAVMFSIAIPMVVSFNGFSSAVALNKLPILCPVLGAILSGCVAGDHISPISDTTIMSATSTQSPHIDHVQTQMTYSVPIIIITAICFLLFGLLQSYNQVIKIFAPLSISMLLMISFFKTRNKYA